MTEARGSSNGTAHAVIAADLRFVTPEIDAPLDWINGSQK